MKMKGLFWNSWKNCWIFWSVRFYVSDQLGFMTFLVSQVFMMSLASHKRFYDISGQSGFYDVPSQSRDFMTFLVSQVFMMSLASHEILWCFWSVSFVTSDQSAFLIFTQFLYTCNFIQICTSKNNDRLFYLPVIWTMNFLETMLIELSLFLHVAGCWPGSLPSCVETRWLWICQYACCLLSNGMFLETLNHI